MDGIPPHIDLLHCDIQGHEADLIRNEGARFVTAGIDYLFLSTHSMDLHNQCTDLLIEYDYTIIAEVNPLQTFCEDGIVVACSPRIKPVYYGLPKR